VIDNPERDTLQLLAPMLIVNGYLSNGNNQLA